MDCGRELLPPAPPQNSDSPAPQARPPAEARQAPTPPAFVADHTDSTRLDMWGHGLLILYVLAAIVLIVAAIYEAGFAGEWGVAAILVAAAISLIVAGLWLRALHSAASAALHLLGRQTEAIEAIARRPQ